MDEYLLGPQFSFLSLLSENGDILLILLPLTGSTYEKKSHYSVPTKCFAISWT